MTSIAVAARFGVVGVVTAAVHYGLLAVGVEAFGMPALIASSAGFVVAVLLNYQMHYHYTFNNTARGAVGQSAPHVRTFSRYVFMISCGFLINAGVMYAAVHGLGLNYLLAQAVALVVLVLWNFLLSCLWVFRL
tara:strand:- start:199292 stop:199693 length:402 start_codon:yes stop_codon:yes gene_type:complete